MSWKEFFTGQTRKFTFDDLDCPEFWIRMKVMGAYPYGKNIEDGALIEKLEKEQKESDGVSLAVITQQATISDRMLAGLIVEWNLTHPETDDPLPLPTVEDNSSLRVLPLAFITAINEWAADVRGVEEVPQSKGN